MQYLREVVGLTGTNIGCDTTSCGACTVLLDGESVKSCTVLAAQADGRAVTTIEGLADGDALHPMQAAFREHHGLQCGYCTPGMVMAAVSLAQERRRAHRGRGAQGARGQPLPLHRLPQHRRRGDRRLGRDGRARERRVIPAAFAYARADSVDEAIALLAEHGDDAKLLAGGHSLLPLMKLRLATPSVLVDVGRLARPLLRPRRRRHARHRWAHPPPRRRARRAVLREHVPLLARGRGRGRRPAGAPPRHARRFARPRRPRVRPARGRARARRHASSCAGAAASARSPPTTSSSASSRPRSRPTRSSPRCGCRKTDGAGWAFEKFNRRAQDWAIVGVAAVGGDAPGRRAREHGLHARARRRGRGRAARRRVAGRRRGRPRPRAPIHRPTSTRRPSTAATSRGCSCGRALTTVAAREAHR